MLHFHSFAASPDKKVGLYKYSIGWSKCNVTPLNPFISAQTNVCFNTDHIFSPLNQSNYTYMKIIVLKEKKERRTCEKIALWVPFFVKSAISINSNTFVARILNQYF